jgi:hypothetical protein
MSDTSAYTGVESAEGSAFPAPYGGMNTREGLSSLQPYEARRLINLVPEGNAVIGRKGHTAFSTSAIAASVTSLYAYEGQTALHLIGIHDGDIWRWDSGAPVKLSDANFTVNPRLIMENYGGRLIGVALGEIPFTYDGTVTAGTGFTGPSSLALLANIAKVRNRLWFCEGGSADVWYGPLGGITGALTAFQLSQVVAGGYCMAIGAYTEDGGAGPDDHTVFVMSTGEVVIYSGDPSTTFTKVGNFRMPPPMGRRCLVSIGGQLAIMTMMGLVPLSAALTGIAMDAMAIGPFGKISPTLKRAVATYGGLPGWQMVYWNGAVIINVPTSPTTSRQAYYNVLTGAWAIFNGLPISAMAVMGPNLYFGHWENGTVYSYSGFSDVGEAIAVESRGAFVASGQRNAVASLMRFDMRCDGAFSGKYGVDVDYRTVPLTVPDETISESVASTPWGSPWGSAWSSGGESEPLWFGTEGEGHHFAVAIEGSLLSETFEWYSSDVMFEPGIRAL